MNRVIQKNFKSILIFSFTFSLFCINGCRKLVESPPPTNQLAETNVYSIDAAAIAVLNGIYISMNGQPMQGTFGISLFSGLSADELTLFSATSANFRNQGYYKNALLSVPGSGSAGSENWAPFFTNIFKCNAAIEGLTKSSLLTPQVKQQLLGEAKFLRAFFYFYLVNLYGDLPICLTTNSEVNSMLSRSSVAKVYEQIIADLKDAEELLSDKFLDATLLSITSERVRPTKWSAIALLARVYLYTNNYANAEDKANTIINNSALFGPISTVSLSNVFLKNSREAIWQIQPTAINFNTQDAQTLVLPVNGPNTNQNPAYLSDFLLNSFEVNDQRAVIGNWIGSVTVGSNIYRFPFKYKKYLNDPTITSSTGSQNMTEYFMVLRLAEQYLIRAESRAKQGNLMGAIDDLDKIRQRAGLPLIAVTNPNISQTALLDKILHERQVEMFTELGHRWLDIKRTGKVDEVMTIVTPQKANGTFWQSYQQLYPIAFDELQKAPNLVQNPGY